MTERGFIFKNENGYSQVRIERHSACGSCGKCGMTEKQKHVDFYVENTLNAQVNDIVEVEIPEANTAGLAFVAYILPLIPALILLFVSIGLKWQDWLSVVLFFAGLAVGFVIVSLVDKFRKRKWTTTPTMKAIITPINYKLNNKGEDNNE